MKELCKAIIDGGAEVSAVALSLIGNLNMVRSDGVEPNQDEVNTLLRLNEEYCKNTRAIIRGWLARLPTSNS